MSAISDQLLAISKLYMKNHVNLTADRSTQKLELGLSF